jgi:hypothetical protein
VRNGRGPFGQDRINSAICFLCLRSADRLILAEGGACFLPARL